MQDRPERKRTPNHQLRRQREARGWSLGQMAKELQARFPEVAVTDKEILRWENGKRRPRPYYREKLSVLFGVPGDQLGFTSPENAFDWGEAPSATALYGRDAELDRLTSLTSEKASRVLAIVGMGGIGKTSLTVELAHRVKDTFEALFWRTLVNAPPARQVIQDTIQCFSYQQYIVFPDDMEDLITLLIRTLRERRCLLVLDNYETILQAGRDTGGYREGYQDYGRLIFRLGETQHQSCFVLTSREKPPEVAMLEGKEASTHSYQLAGLSPASGQMIFKDKGLSGDQVEQEALVLRYGGNPLSLKLVSQFIREVFNGEIAAFLREGAVIFHEIQAVLDQQFERLSRLQQELLYWLAIEREAVPLPTLHEDLIGPVSRKELLSALRSASRRHLMEATDQGFLLQNVVMEYLTDRLIQEVCAELQTGTLALCKSHALMQAQAREYIRESQIHLIVEPIGKHLLGGKGSETLLKGILAQLRSQETQQPNYAAGNILNLLIQLGYDLRGSDFSELEIRQAYLQGVALPEVNFAFSRLLNCLFTETFGGVFSVAFSPDGMQVAVGTTEGEIRIWNIAGGVPLLTLRGHTDWVRAVVFSPNGKTLISGSDDQNVRIWDVETGEALNVLRGHTHWIFTIALSPDGKMLVSGGEDRMLLLWDVETGLLLKTLQGHQERVWSVAFSPDGELIASGSNDESIHIWKVQTGQLLKTFYGHTGSIWKVQFSPDGKTLVSSGGDPYLILWEIESGCQRQLKALLNQGQGFWSVAFSPDGERLVCGGEDSHLYLWEVQSGQLLKILQGHNSRIKSVAWSLDGKTIVSGGEDGSMRLWDGQTGQLHKTLQGYNSQIYSLAFSPDGQRLACGGEDLAVHLWNVESGELIADLHGHTCRIWSVAFSPDAKMAVSGGDDRSVRLWDIQTQRPLQVFPECSRWVLSVAFSADGNMVAAGDGDQKICLWNIRSGQLLKTLQGGHTKEIWSLAFSPNGKYLASSSEDHKICLWDIKTGQLLKTLEGHEGEVWSIAFSPDGQTLISGGADQCIIQWEVETGNMLQVLRGHTGVIRSVAISFDGKFIASGSDDQSVSLWDQETGRRVLVLQEHNDRVIGVAFSPDGLTIASGSIDSTIKIWDRQAGQCLKTLRSERPYERMNITRVEGLTDVQRNTLKLLGAIEKER